MSMQTLIHTLRRAPVLAMSSKRTVGRSLKKNAALATDSVGQRPLSLSPAAATQEDVNLGTANLWSTSYEIAVREPAALMLIKKDESVSVRSHDSWASFRTRKSKISAADAEEKVPSRVNILRQTDDLHKRLFNSHIERANALQKSQKKRRQSSKSIPPRCEPLNEAIRLGDTDAAIRCFCQLLSNKEYTHPVPYGLAKALFSLLVKKPLYKDLHPMCMVFEYLTTGTTTGNTKSIILIVTEACKAITNIDPKIHHTSQSIDLVYMVERYIQKLDGKIRDELYPLILIAIARQKSINVGKMGKRIYGKMCTLGTPLTQSHINSLLATCKYNNRDSLPYPELLQRSLDNGWMPLPHILSRTIESMFPYTNKCYSRVITRVFAEIQGRDIEEGNESKYRLSTETLEYMAIGAAQSGCAQTIMSIWDILEQSKIRPTQSIYESTVIAFAYNQNTINNAFEAMVSMKEEGFPIPRALVRSFSTAIRSDTRFLKDSFRFLREEHQSQCAITETLNVVLSGFAERGDIWLFQSVTDYMFRSDIPLNADSYSFAIEVLGKDVSRATNKKKSRDFQQSLTIASEYLARMETAGIEPTADIVRNYVELLCQVGEISTAVGVLDDLIDNGRQHLANSKAIYRAAIECANTGRLDDAERLASHLTPSMTKLQSIISSRKAARNRIMANGK